MQINWKTEKRKISELIPTENNPRQLTDKQYKDLKKSLSKFDLAEIPAINKDNTILAGHMRLKVLYELKGDCEIDVRVPNKQLSPKEAEEYLIRSNKNTGEWDYESLANSFEINDLQEWGFDLDELTFAQEIDKLKDGEEIEFEKSVQIEPPKEYVLIMADPNSVEWEDMKEKLMLKMVRRGGYKKGSAFDAVGLERVIEWGDFKERVNAYSSSK